MPQTAQSSPSSFDAGAAAAAALRQLELASVRTEQHFALVLKAVATFLHENDLGDLQSLSAEAALAYLEARGQEVRQKTLDLDRLVLQAVLGEALPVIRAELTTTISSRAYTLDQAGLVADAQSEKHALATRIAVDAGLAARELLTLLPVAERPADARRALRPDRFTGRSGIRLYTVESRRTLVREVGIDQDLAEALEARRLAEPRAVSDREIPYQQHYDLGGGKQWTDSFGAAARRELGWSTGAHGLRHTYAQARMRTLQGSGYSYRIALAVVGQEMGHFGPAITEAYLR